MKLNIFIKLAMAIVVLLCLSANLSYSEELIIILSSEAKDEEVNSVLNKYNISEKSTVYLTDKRLKYILVATYEDNLKDMIEKIKTEKEVIDVYLNFELKLQSDFSSTELLEAITGYNELFDLEDATGYLHRFPGEKTMIAYLDSGFLYQGHDLINELIISGRLINEGNGYGIDFTSDPNTNYPEDNLGHGTAVASLGLAHSSNSCFFIAKVSEEGELRFLKLLNALDHVKTLSQHFPGNIIINMSLNVPIEDIVLQYQAQGYSEEEARQKYTELIDWFQDNYIGPLLDAGVVLVSTAYNGGDVDVFPGNLSGVICVGELSLAGEVSLPDVLAPSMVYVADKYFSSLNFDEGSSYGAALVSAFLGELLRVNYNLTADELKIIMTCNDFQQGIDIMLSFLDTGIVPESKELAPVVDFALFARLATVYSAFKSIKEGLDKEDQELINSGAAKIEIDLGYVLPIQFNLTDNFLDVTNVLREEYRREKLIGLDIDSRSELGIIPTNNPNTDIAIFN
jgi:uncharacterized protein YlbG (UPF0298 family)